MSDEGYQGSLTSGGQCGAAAGIIYFTMTMTVPFGGRPAFNDCFGCGPPRNVLLEHGIFLAVVLGFSTAFGFAASSIYNWLERSREAEPGQAVEAPALAISTATMLAIFQFIWCLLILR